MNNIDWDLIEIFLVVAETGSFTAAAAELGISQPTVSRQVKALEDELDVNLFARHARGFELTDRGAALLDSARAVQQGVQTFLRRAAGVDGSPGGTVRVSAAEPVAIYLLMPFIARLQEEHSDLDVELVVENREANLLRLEADVAIRMFRPTQLDLVAQRVADLPLGFFASRDYLDRHGIPLSVDDLEDHRIIGYDRDAEPYRGLAELGIELERSDFRLRTDSLVAQYEAVRHGVGIGGGQHAIFGSMDQVEQVLPQIDLPPLPVWLAVHQDLRHSPPVRLVVDRLAELFRGLE
ncbi:MAG: LysR family transcriptional regulator [Myxococcota bacterium]